MGVIRRIGRQVHAASVTLKSPIDRIFFLFDIVAIVIKNCIVLANAVAKRMSLFQYKYRCFPNIRYTHA